MVSGSLVTTGTWSHSTSTAIRSDFAESALRLCGRCLPLASLRRRIVALASPLSVHFVFSYRIFLGVGLDGLEPCSLIGLGVFLEGSFPVGTSSSISTWHCL